jgi:acetyltransferase
MTTRTLTIERLRPPVSDSDLRALAELLVDAVESGAAVSFVAPLSRERAEVWWRTTTGSSDARAVFLVARDAGGIAGTVQLHPAWAPNQPHRADIAKLIVDRRFRRSGLGTELMQAIEREARHAGFTLLTLDAKRGAPAERLYRQLGWTAAGVIPGFALDSDGTPHDAVIFYKHLPTTDEHVAGAGPRGRRRAETARS